MPKPVPVMVYHTSGAVLKPVQEVPGPSVVAVAVLPVAVPPQAMDMALAHASLAGAGTAAGQLIWKV